MALINLKEKDIQVKNVYYGLGRSGKTSNLEYIHRNFANRINTEMVTAKTHGDCTLFLTSFHLISDSSIKKDLI